VPIGGAQAIRRAAAEYEGELDVFRSFQNQLFWRGRPVEAQLRGWLQNGGRYLRYPPLAGVLRAVA